MRTEQAAEIVSYLLAAFRPRDWSDASSAVYIESLLDLDFDEALKAVRWGVTEQWRFMPAVMELRKEIIDDYHAPRIETLDRTALPGHRPPMLPGDVDPELAKVVELVTHRATETDDPHIRYDPEQVKLRKAEARAAAATERKRIAAEKRRARAKEPA